LRQPKGAAGVHAQREDHAPILRIIAQGETLDAVSPNAQNQQERNPPRARCPEKEGEALEEGQQLDQQ
jgi:hypothetical protein